jgi:hypothetical protein
MSGNILVQYVGFQAKALVREYTFSVREAGELREFTLTIANEAFDSHRIRYQDAPDVCSLKLHGELAANANHPSKTHYRITDAELDQYRESHSPKSARSLYPRNGARDA